MASKIDLEIEAIRCAARTDQSDEHYIEWLSSAANFGLIGTLLVELNKNPRGIQSLTGFPAKLMVELAIRSFQQIMSKIVERGTAEWIRKQADEECGK